MTLQRLGIARNKLQYRSELDGRELGQLPVRPCAKHLEVVNINIDVGRRTQPKNAFDLNSSSFGDTWFE